MPDDPASSDNLQLIPFLIRKLRLNPNKNMSLLSQDLNEKLLSLSTEIDVLKSFVLEQDFVNRKATKAYRTS